MEDNAHDPIYQSLTTPEPQGNAVEVERIEKWWHGVTQGHIDMCVPKMVEYGSSDLTDIGHDMARVSGRTISDDLAREWGIMFYARGKMARWLAAAERGEPVSRDTLDDLIVYATLCLLGRDEK